MGMWMLWLGLALAEPVRFIETRELVLEIHNDDVNLQVLHATLTAAMTEKGIRKLARRNEDGSLTTAKVPQLNAEETMACLIVISHDKLGAEADLMVTVDGPAVPVTVWWNVQREIRVASGPPPKDLFPSGPSAKTLSAQFGVGELQEVDRPWEPQARGLLKRALELLTEEERSLIDGLPYVRQRVPTASTRARINNPDGGQLQATYNSDQQGSRIEVYDNAFINSARFSGTPWDPRPSSLAVLLHEIGHAIAWSSTRALVSRSEALVASHRQKGVAFDEQSNQREALIVSYQRTNSDATLKQIRDLEVTLGELKNAGDTLAHQSEEIAKRVEARKLSPAAGALRRVVAMTDSPTWYGKTSVEEHFAECFAMYHLDPKALKRASPAAFDWFAAGKHLKVTHNDL